MSFVCEACGNKLDDTLQASRIPEEYEHLHFVRICKTCAVKRRTCTGTCGRTYPATTRFFYRNRTGSSKYGLYPVCKTCSSKRAARYYILKIARARKIAVSTEHCQVAPESATIGV